MFCQVQRDEQWYCVKCSSLLVSVPNCKKATQSSLDGVQVLLQVERLDLDLLSKVILHWSNCNGVPDLHQLLRIKKWAVEIKESFFSSPL